jgi:hypothetical protein
MQKKTQINEENQPKESRFTMENCTPHHPKTQLDFVFHHVCDECSLPLRLYGENFIESYSNGKANSLRVLCDIHAEGLDLFGEVE